MKVGIALGKVTEIQELINKHAKTKATIEYLEKEAVNSKPVQDYIENMKNTLTNIENIFDELLK